MQIKIKGDPVDGGKKPTKVRVKAPTPTPAELEAANKMARDISVRRGLIMGENVHTGGQIPKFIEATTGKELLPGDIDPAVGRLSNKVPLYVKSLEWDSKAGLPFYVDEKTGDMQYVAKDLFHSPRFSPNRGKTSLLQSVAKR